MIVVSNADRVVFPAVGRTKGDVVAYYQRIAERALAHLGGRPLSIRRFPKGLAGPGFFQKNVPPHYPASIARIEVPRSKAAAKAHARPGKGTGATDVTTYPIVVEAEHLAYLANQGAIELHVPTVLATDMLHPDRLVIDLDPPSGAVALVQRAAHLTRAALREFGLESAPVATGSKGYHVVAPLHPALDVETLAITLQKFAVWLAARHPDELTTVFRIAGRGQRVFVDWLRNLPNATVVAPYSLRATPRATIAAPLAWEEIDRTPPDAFTLDDVEPLVTRTDALRELARTPGDPSRFRAAVDEAFAASGLVLEPFDRFRS